MRQETDYVTHHIQKIVGFFAAMRHFAQSLEMAGHTVVYYKINDAKNTQSLTNNILQIIHENNIEQQILELNNFVHFCFEDLEHHQLTNTIPYQFNFPNVTNKYQLVSYAAKTYNHITAGYIHNDIHYYHDDLRNKPIISKINNNTINVNNMKILYANYLLV
jgi:deoxyribodipyrimidine photolyase-like uncharacterized protein